MTAPARLSVISVGTHDVTALRAFYENLGWETNSKGDDFAAFPLGGAVLALYQLDKLAGEAHLPEPELGDAFRGYTLAINVDDEHQVAETLAIARDAGATVLAEPVKREWGGVSAYFADPEGNAWEIAWLPGATFDERGALIWPY
jgi:catechol 2,3-dioxygenase-like lactoylglutathione lyase family enzyme